MPNRDLKNRISTAVSLRPAARTATATGSAVDLANYDSAVVQLHVGTITDGTHTPTLEESDASGSGYTTVAAADLQGSFAALATNTDQEVGYIGKKQYVRVVTTASGTTTGGVYAASVIRGHARNMPA